MLHATGYYTLNQIPKGEKVNLSTLVKTSSGTHQGVHHDNVSSENLPTSASTKVTPTKSSPKRIIEMPSTWKNGPDQSISIGTKPGLKYDLELIEVKAGSKVKITFNNNDDMLHNLVIVKPTTAIQVGEDALKLGLEGSQKKLHSQFPKCVVSYQYTGSGNLRVHLF